MSAENILKNAAFRAEIREILNADGDKLQKVLATGYNGEELKLLRVQSHGFSSSPPAGSLAAAIAIGGRRDMALLLGGEMPGQRMVKHRGGGLTVYDTGGQYMAFDLDKVSMVTLGPLTMTVSNGKITLESDQGVDIKAPSVSMNGAGLGGGNSVIGGSGGNVDLGGTGGKRIRLEDGSLTSNVRAVN